jgi:hypothetical protein
MHNKGICIQLFAKGALTRVGGLPNIGVRMGCGKAGGSVKPGMVATTGIAVAMNVWCVKALCESAKARENAAKKGPTAPSSLQ